MNTMPDDSMTSLDQTAETSSDPRRHPVGDAIKRFIDIIGSLILLIILSPFFFILAALVMLADRGPAFFGHTRIGKNGVPFCCWKFRTMVIGAETQLAAYLQADPDAAIEWATHHKLTNDPRVTWIGSFLRKSSMDELPQLWNVLCGQMSLVGPRPVTEIEINERYGAHATTIVSIRPGITGLWQVSGRSDMDYVSRVQLDLDYVHSRCLTTDLWILVVTVPYVLQRRGAH